MTNPRMTFSGTSLELLRDAVGAAISDTRMHIGSCPDVVEYAEDIDELEDHILKLERLYARIDRKLQP